jgi:succinylglutamic semialdehyde dehydrogenase
VQVDRFTTGVDDCGCDEEVFGPMLRISFVDSLDEAIEQANATRYGLAASIFTADAGSQARFLAESRAGCVNINCGTAGASSKLPFGGLGFSGNHRPAGAFSLDYCAYPVATMIEGSDASTLAQGMRVERDWVK